jgi:hypothetical protein
MPKTPAATAAAAFACAALMLTTACSSPAPHPLAAPGSTTAARSPAARAAQLTPAQARQAFGALLPKYAAMVKGHVRGQVTTLTTGAQAQVMAFETAHNEGFTTPAQLSERFYVPRLAGYPRWFAEVGTTRTFGVAGGDVFIVAQSHPAGPWQVADTSLWDGATLAQTAAIALDAQGYATAVPPADTTLVTPPGQLPAQYAHLLAGTASPASSRYAAGDATSQWAATQQQVIRQAPADGWRVSFSYTVPPGTEYALAARGGGAVVFFAFAQSSTWVSTSQAPKFSGGGMAYTGQMPVITAVDAGLTTMHPRVGTEITSTYLCEPVALDPPHNGQISMMERDLDGGGPSAATLG